MRNGANQETPGGWGLGLVGCGGILIAVGLIVLFGFGCWAIGEAVAHGVRAVTHG